MWNKLDERKRRIVAILAAIVVMYMAYRFSFGHAIAAYHLNGSLKKEAGLQLEDAAYPHLNKKHIFYSKVLESYKVKKAEMDTKIWQAISDMAVAQQVKVAYNPTASAALDTTAQQNIFEQQFSFKGKYFELVKLLDTLSKSTQIGKVSQMTVAAPKEQQAVKVKDQLEMKLTLSAVTQ